MRGKGGIFCVIIAAMLCGCRFRPDNNAVDDSPRDAAAVLADEMTQKAESMADSMLSTMTLDQKIAQTLMPALYSESDAATIARLKEYAEYGVGGLVLLRGNSASAKAIGDTLHALSGIEPFIAIDAEWGLGMRLEDEPRYPSSRNVGKEADEPGMFEYGVTLGKECRRLGINMLLGPVLDVAGEDSYMYRRSYSDDAHRVADLSVAYARGVESCGVISVAKHFPGHGSVTADSHSEKPIISRSLQSLDSIDLYPFRKYIEQDLSAIMVGHLALPAIDSESRPGAVSRIVITDLLRKDMGFRGLVLTDALNMHGVENYGPVDALQAGANIILAPADTRSAINAIRTAIADSILTESDLDAAVRRILLAKSYLKLR